VTYKCPYILFDYQFTLFYFSFSDNLNSRRREQQEKLSEKAIREAKLKEIENATAALEAATANPKENGPMPNITIPTTLRSG
jgi:type II secretory pathway component PulM